MQIKGKLKKNMGNLEKEGTEVKVRAGGRNT
jgi:hypothetical protein